MWDNDEGNHSASKSRQSKVNKEADTPVNISLLPTCSTVAVQNKDGGPRIHRTIIGYGSEDHNWI